MMGPPFLSAKLPVINQYRQHGGGGQVCFLILLFCLTEGFSSSLGLTVYRLFLPAYVNCFISRTRGLSSHLVGMH